MDVKLIDAYKNGGLEQMIGSLSHQEIFSILTEKTMMPSEVNIKSAVITNCLLDYKELAAVFIEAGNHKTNTLIVLLLFGSARDEDKHELSKTLICLINILIEPLPITFEAIMTTIELPWHVREEIQNSVHANRVLY